MVNPRHRSSGDGKRLFLLELYEILKLQKPSHVVGVAVSVQDLINAPHVLANALMAQVGRRVDEKSFPYEPGTIQSEDFGF